MNDLYSSGGLSVARSRYLVRLVRNSLRLTAQLFGVGQSCGVHGQVHVYKETGQPFSWPQRLICFDGTQYSYGTSYTGHIGSAPTGGYKRIPAKDFREAEERNHAGRIDLVDFFENALPRVLVQQFLLTTTPENNCPGDVEQLMTQLRFSDVELCKSTSMRFTAAPNLRHHAHDQCHRGGAASSNSGCPSRSHWVPKIWNSQNQCGKGRTGTKAKRRQEPRAHCASEHSPLRRSHCSPSRLWKRNSAMSTALIHISGELHHG